MKATCIRDCTVPGRGMVVVGQVIDVPDGATVKSMPCLKHFKLDGVVQAADTAPTENTKVEAKPKAAKPAKAKAPADDFLN